MKHLLGVLRFMGIKTHRSFRLTLRGIALIIGLAAAYRVSVLLEKQNFEVAIYFYLIVVVAAFAEFVLADVLADRSFPFDTERKLALMERRLGNQAITAISNCLEETIQQFNGCDRTRILAAVHVVAELTSTADKRVRAGLLQLTDYVGLHERKGKRKREKGRVTLINQGVIGRCARTKRVETVDFADRTEYDLAMVREFGFTEKEAKDHTRAARSYLAFPLIYDDELVGVLYFFTSEPQVFPRSAAMPDIERAAKEIVNYLDFAQLT